jgi:ribosome-associated toxin RatA of RatAB toxin-antitoxin module
VTWVLLPSLLALVVLASGVATVALPASLRDLPQDQRSRLNAGEVIVSATLPPNATASARGGTAMAIVRASPEQVWRVLVDYPGHARYYPRVVAAEMVERDARRVLVRYEVGIGPFSFAFHMDKFPDARRRRIDWHLAEGHGHGLFRENSGYWQIDETGAASLVTYAIAVRTLLPGFITRGAEQDSLIETVTAMRKLVEEGDEAGRSPK